MKVKMTCNYSDRLDHPRTGDVLDVLETLWEGEFVESYRCDWQYRDIFVYPYECEEV